MKVAFCGLGRLIFSVFLLTSAAWSATYYVSPEGDDSKPGMQSKPWRTLSKVNATKLSAGDQVLLQGSQTFDGNLVIDEGSHSNPAVPIVVGSYGRGRAVIRAGRGTGILVRNIGGVVIRDLVLEGAGGDTNRGFGIEVLNERGAQRLDLVQLDNLDVSGFHWAGIYVGGVPDLPASREVPAGRYGFRQVRISRCVAYRNVYYGIWVSGPWNHKHEGYANENVTISDSVAHDNPGDPAYKENHSGNGILLDDTDQGFIDHCTAYHNGYANGSQEGGPVGIWADESNRITIQFCESYDNRTAGASDGGGFDLDGGVTNSVMQYNYSHGNDGAGYLVWNYWGAVHPLANNVIRYNISENDGRKHRYGAISVGSLGEAISGLQVYNNTLFSTASDSAEPKVVWVGGSQKDSGICFRNNLFIADRVPLVEVDRNEVDVLFQGNDYWARGGEFTVLDRDRTFHSLEEWRTRTGQERLNGRPVGMSKAPEVTNPGSGGTLSKRPLSSLASYRLLPSSPLIDVGIDLRAEFGLNVGRQDFWGTPIPQGKAFDIGACEARRP